MIPTVGRIVLYQLTGSDAEQINKRRQDANTRSAANRSEGVVVHTGNDVRAGEIYPLMITKVWTPNTEDTDVNGQLFLDGNDTFWVTSGKQAKGSLAPGLFMFPEYVPEKQRA